MEIKVNTIITLDNQEKYMALSETFYEDMHYYLMMGLDSNREPDSSKVAIFQEEITNDGVYVIQVEDNSLIRTLTNLLKSQL